MSTKLMAMGALSKNKQIIDFLTYNWTPPSNGLEMWFDANKIVGLSDADPLLQWDDLSGNDYHLDTINFGGMVYKKDDGDIGRPSIYFPNPSLITSSTGVSALKNVGGATIICVGVHINDGFTRYMFGFTTAVAGYTRFGLRKTPDVKVSVAGRRLDDDTLFSLENSGADTQYHIYTGLADYSNTFAAGLIDGLIYADSSSFQTSGNTSDTDSAKVGIGITSDFKGKIAEILVYSRKLNQTELNSIHSYLSLKYGISLDGDS